MAQRTSAAIYVDDVMADPHLVHEGKRDNGKGLVHFPKVHVILGPSNLLKQFLRRGYWGRGEQAWGLSMAGVPFDVCTNGHTFGLCDVLRGQNQCGSPIRNGR